MVFFTAVVAAVLLLDQATKWLVVQKMPFEGSIPLIKNIFHLTYVENTGAAFGILPDQVAFFIGVSLVAIVLLVLYYRQTPKDDYWLKSALCRIMGGAVGNLIDRVRLGVVIDFLDFRVWPVFNLADVAISVGVSMLVFHLYFQDEKVN